MTSPWRILASDLVTGEVIATVPVENARFTRTLNRAGAVRGTVPLRAAPPQLLEGARTVLYLEVGGLIRADGIVWDPRPARSADSNTADVAFRGEALASYWASRRVRRTLAFNQVDQAEIIRQLVAYTEETVGIGIDTDGPMPAGTPRDETFLADERRNIGRAIELLTDRIGWPDVDVEVTWPDPTSNPVRRLKVWDHRGKTVPGRWRLGENILGYDIQSFGSRTANRVDVIGTGEGDDMVIGTAADPSVLGSWPQLDEAWALKDIVLQGTANDHAAARLAARSTPPRAISLQVDPNARPRLGAYDLGDVIDLQLRDGPLVLEEPVRIVEITIGVTSGVSTPDVTVTCNTLNAETIDA